MGSTREHIYLAALLHDIGKFYQRADLKFSDKRNELSEHSKQIANDICPTNEYGRFGYQHVIWTNEFFERCKCKLEQIPSIKQNVWNKNNINEDCLANLACNHHRPTSKMQGFITLADWWSAGLDRREDLEEENNNPTDVIRWGHERYKKKPLYSIFNKLNNGNYCSAFHLNPLSLSKDKFFPILVTSEKDGISQNDYSNLWKGFYEEFEKLPTDTFNAFVESLLFLLKKYTWCIPSNTNNNMSNVSLFDHLKTTAALADCFYQYDINCPNEFKWDNGRLTLQDKVMPVLLVGGDLSGIQKFIYNIVSKKAAVSLKGRSFYLQLLIDSAIQRILAHRSIDATMAQVVYSSGGKFYMLLPNTKKVKDALAELQDEFEKELWEKHNGLLQLNMSYVSFAYNFKGVNGKISFEEQRDVEIGLLWKRLADKLTEVKNKKFQSILLSKFEDLFIPQNIKAGTLVCAVTGVESEKCILLDNDSDEKIYVLPIVKEQADLGKVLKDIDFIITHKGKCEYLRNKYKCDIEIFGIHNYLFDQKELLKDDADFRTITSADVCFVKRINESNFLIPLKGHSTSYGFQFYGGNKQALTEAYLNKTFEELADKQYLGVLRMDVDNLGSIFIKGFPDEMKSFSAYSTLSFMLDYFFSGYLNTIKEENDYSNDVNIIYSGGDDVFAVGRWDKLILFAEKIRKDFSHFIGRNDISISGGITIVGDKYPIAKAAEMAGDAEDAAKKENNGNKNAFNMFGETISWNAEFDFVKNIKERFYEMCSKKSMSKSILHKLMNLCLLKRKGDYSYSWHTAYYLKRYSENKSDEIKNFCKELQCILCNGRQYDLVAIAARWAELELKFENK